MSQVLPEKGTPIRGGMEKRLHEQMLKPAQVVRTGRKIGRNEPCPCGSLKKYKKCHATNGGN